MARARPLDVLFEDDRFLAVSKPAGVAVHGGAGIRTPPVVHRIPRGVRPVHRLDAGTSGVLLLAKDSDSARVAAAAWGEASKVYWAAVVGRAGAAHINRPLDDGSGRMQPARTDVRPIEASGDGAWTWVEATLGTGRNHQIRRHLAGFGHPVVMDDRYGDFAANKRFRHRVRAAGAPNPKHALLHARRLQVLDLDLVAPLPSRWHAWLGAVGIDLLPDRPD